MLNLPANFKNDIQGSDTALVPVISIGSMVISTNEYTGYINGEVSYHTLPLLLNIPSLKESIDVEKRNYKISSVNLDISNYLYEGERFSDRMGDKSLINTECYIFWRSPSCDKLEGLSDDPARMPLIYFGTIRRYTHDDEKVKLVVEDRSQAKLHKDLPLETHYLKGDDVPDKYKNKPIPMVYGHVERSPMIPYYANIVEETETVTELQLLADNRAITTNGFVESTQPAGTTPLPISALYFFANDQYWNVARLDDDNNVNFQYSIADTGSIIILDIDAVVGSESDTVISNDFSKGHLGTYIIRQIKKVSPLQQGVSGGNVGTVFSDIGMGKLVGILDVDTPNSSSYTIAGFRLWLDDITITPQLAVDDDGDEIHPKTYLYLRLDHYNFQDNIPAGQISNPGSHYTNWNYWVQGEVINESGVQVGTVSYSGGSPPSSFFFDNITGTHSPIDISERWGSLDSKQYFSVGMPKHTTNSIDLDVVQVDTTLKDSFIVHRIFVSGILDKEYYANVKGRAMDSNDLPPTAPSAIAHILENELGQNVEPFETQAHYDWKYSFTIDKKINSKKLIEGIASVSPYIPRFNNMGEFRFDVIKSEYNVLSLSDNFTPYIEIKADDIISSSFSRTKIEDVKTKVVFKYNWNYGRGEFDNSYSIQINNVAPFDTSSGQEIDTGFWSADGLMYSYSYYGILEDESESTLIIDDDRGKYVRDPETAKEFATWMLRMNANQHLKIKCRLPLSMGLPIEIGDILRFDKIIDVKPFGISYNQDAVFYTDPVEQSPPYYGDMVNGQQVFPDFMCISTNKTLEFCEISLLQMHNLTNQLVRTEVYGCMNSGAWNYNGAATQDDGSCLLPPWSNDGSLNSGSLTQLWQDTFVVPGVCPFFMLDPDTFASNYPADLISSFDFGENLFDTDNHIYDMSNPAHYPLAFNFWAGGGTPVFYNHNNCIWEDVVTNSPQKFVYLLNPSGSNANTQEFNFQTIGYQEQPNYNTGYGWEYVQFANPEGQFNEMIYDGKFEFMINRFDFNNIGQFQPVRLRIELLSGFLYREPLDADLPPLYYYLDFSNAIQWSMTTSLITLSANTDGTITIDADDFNPSEMIQISNDDMLLIGEIAPNVQYFERCIWTLNFDARLITEAGGASEWQFSEWYVPFTIRFGSTEQPISTDPASWGG